LLLAAQITGRRSHSRSEGFPAVASETVGCPSPRSLNAKAATLRPYLVIALIFAILFTGGYTISKVILGYRHQRNMLAIFGREVRREAAAHRWRYEVVSSRDEGLLLYLQKTHFVELDHAVSEWNNGNLDALVASTEKAPGVMSQLLGATVSQLKSKERKKEQGTSYVLITR